MKYPVSTKKGVLFVGQIPLPKPAKHIGRHGTNGKAELQFGGRVLSVCRSHYCKKGNPLATNMLFMKQGKLELLKYLIGLPPDDIQVFTWKNYVLPFNENLVIGAGAGDLIESTYPGYNSQSLTDFSVPILNGFDEGESASPTLTWTCSGGGTSERIFGVGIYVNLGGTGIKVWFAQYLPASVNMENAGDSFSCKINLTDFQHNKIGV